MYVPSCCFKKNLFFIKWTSLSELLGLSLLDVKRCQSFCFKDLNFTNQPILNYTGRVVPA
jgi:hypothetical protein